MLVRMSSGSCIYEVDSVRRMHYCSEKFDKFEMTLLFLFLFTLIASNVVLLVTGWFQVPVFIFGKVWNVMSFTIIIITGFSMHYNLGLVINLPTKEGNVSSTSE